MNGNACALAYYFATDGQSTSIFMPPTAPGGQQDGQQQHAPPERLLVCTHEHAEKPPKSNSSERLVFVKIYPLDNLVKICYNEGKD